MHELLTVQRRVKPKREVKTPRARASHALMLTPTAPQLPSLMRYRYCAISRIHPQNRSQPISLVWISSVSIVFTGLFLIKRALLCKLQHKRNISHTAYIKVQLHGALFSHGGNTVTWPSGDLHHGSRPARWVLRRHSGSTEPVANGLCARKPLWVAGCRSYANMKSKQETFHVRRPMAVNMQRLVWLRKGRERKTLRMLLAVRT